MADEIGFLPPRALAHPAFEPLQTWLPGLGDRPGIDELNALAAASKAPPATASGQPVRFCAPRQPGGKQYERRIFDSGEVDTRPDNLHDLFNALAWLTFPQTKAAINARHVACAPSTGNARGPLRDLLTLVDEGGVIVACGGETLPTFETLIRQFRWQELFWDRRAQLLRDARFILVGHSAYEKALNPYAGITCKALFVAVSRQHLEDSPADLVTRLDAGAASWLLGLPDDASPRRMPPLPVFGYPGWLPGSASAGFYADRRWFRPGPATGRTPEKLGHAA